VIHSQHRALPLRSSEKIYRLELARMTLHSERLSYYAQSKLANLLFTYELRRRLTGTRTIAAAAHPGASSTVLSRNTSPWIRLITGPFELTSQPAAMGARQRCVSPPIPAW
jgi:NAD(P)-dependent dehydrogenase (short-subunit alcohol dehydrogenase family)